MKAAGWLMVTMGCLVLLFGAWYAFETVSFVRSTESTSGVVVEHEFSHGLNSGYREVGSRATQTTAMFSPIVEFVNADGGTTRFRANWSEGDPPAVGSEVEVRYNPEWPEDARIGGFFNLFGGALIFLLLGAVFSAGGVLAIRR